MIILDTSFLIDLFRGKEGLLDYVDDEVATTVISYHEILSGIKQRKAKKEERFFRNFFSKIPILPYTQLTAEHSSSLSATLSNIGSQINALDVLIAAIAIENGAEKILSKDKDFLEISKIGDIQSIIYE
ncbi:MAG: type II toxin-antitoxin system VapC family toxin [Candidatus Ranarchaeia archaeon]